MCNLHIYICGVFAVQQLLIIIFSYILYNIYLGSTCLNILAIPVHVPGTKYKWVATPLLPPSALNGVGQVVWPVHVSTCTSCSQWR